MDGSSILSAASEYLRQGCAVIPIPAREKAPRIKNWPALRIAEPEVANYFGNGSNVGMLLGAASKGLVYASGLFVTMPSSNLEARSSI